MQQRKYISIFLKPVLFFQNSFFQLYRYVGLQTSSLVFLHCLFSLDNQCIHSREEIELKNLTGQNNGSLVVKTLFLFTLKLSLTRLGIVIFQQTIVLLFSRSQINKNVVFCRFSQPNHPGTSADATQCKQSQEQNRSITGVEEYCIRQGLQNI